MGLLPTHQPCCHCPKLAPSTKLSPFHRSPNGTRATHSCIIQILLGHFFCGEYYARFVPLNQYPARAVILSKHMPTFSQTPIYDAHQHHLRALSRTLSLPVILGTKSSLEALAKIVTESYAFSKDVLVHMILESSYDSQLNFFLSQY